MNVNGFQGNRNFAVMQGIAGLLLNASVGERFDRISDLQSRYGVGIGTIHTAIRNIEMMGAVTLRRAGHQGTYVEALDTKQLWTLSGRPPLVGVFPQFTAPEMRTARLLLRQRMAAAGVPFTTFEQPGSKARIDAVAEGRADFAVLSSGVADQMAPKQREALSIFSVDTIRFHNVESLVILHRVGTEPHGQSKSCRTGIDSDSSDHFRLSMAEFAGTAPDALVECNYPDIPRLILENRIDRAVWHRIDTIVPLELIGMGFAPLASPDARNLFTRISRVTLVARAEDAFIGKFAVDNDATGTGDTAPV